jgi:hypothetical protein
LAEIVNLLEAALRRIAGDLEAAGLEWALVGGLAVSVRAEPRTTRDVDVVVKVVSDESSPRCRRSPRSFRPNVPFLLLSYEYHGILDDVGLPTRSEVFVYGACERDRALCAVVSDDFAFDPSRVDPIVVEIDAVINTCSEAAR